MTEIIAIIVTWPLPLALIVGGGVAVYLGRRDDLREP